MHPTTLPRREGFWYSKQEPLLPMPVQSDTAWEGKEAFLIALVELELGSNQQHYKGISACRICSRGNGDGEFEADGWVWPSGYSHYIQAHNVRPSLAFQEFVLGKILSSE